MAEPILRAVSVEGFKRPTPIQAQAIRPLLQGRAVVGISQTGTGKTASFVLPLLHRFGEQRRRRLSRMVGALVLTPTRELASQIVKNIKTNSQNTWARPANRWSDAHVLKHWRAPIHPAA
ncbi:DEAD/DEAH box helicase [uncultured Roseibium sp.]|uniref:DEAD/DEAH box helicase n=1 Tax=uncultured Roseibium sp. TaxID=1936171 RepID=UPI00262361C6|nr:DEAD/DEAH box helicase [uncultured Roseibium sp.]